jgi:hypothetical protein
MSRRNPDLVPEDRRQSEAWCAPRRESRRLPLPLRYALEVAAMFAEGTGIDFDDRVYFIVRGWAG